VTGTCASKQPPPSIQISEQPLSAIQYLPLSIIYVHVVFSKPTKTYIYQNLSPNIVSYFLEALCTLRTMALEQILHCGVSQDISFFRERDYTRISLRGKEFKTQQQSAQAARSYPEPSRRALSYWIR